MRSYGVIVNDTPTQFNESLDHSIKAEGQTIPLALDGVISYFESQKPAADELENCRRITLTSDKSWNPNDTSFTQQEGAAKEQMDPIVHDISAVERDIPFPELMLVEELTERLVSCVYVSYDEIGRAHV